MKFTITLEVETRPFTAEEASEEAELTGMDPEDFMDDEADAGDIGGCFASYLSECSDEALAGSNIMTKIVRVTAI